MSIALVLAGVITLIHYFSQRLSRLCKPFYSELASFSAGVGISYLFLQLFPEFIESANRVFFIPVLAGFVIWHLVEKYIYETAPRNKVFKELALEDSIISFLYHVIVGIVLADIAKTGQKEALLFFVPVALYTALSTLPVDFSKNSYINLMLSSSTFLGAFMATMVDFDAHFKLVLMGFVIGTMAFTIIRHSIPQGKSGQPLYFLAGVAIYSILIFALG